MEMITEKVLNYIRRNPACRADHIAEHFGFAPADIRPELEQLKREKRVRTKGNTRGQQYFAKA